MSSSLAQMGVYHYDHLAHKQGLHHCIVKDILETGQGDICLLCTVTNNDNTISRPYMYRINENRQVIEQGILGTLSINSLRKLILLPDGKLRVYGTFLDGAQFTPYICNLDQSGHNEVEINTTTSYSIYLGGTAMVDLHDAGPDGKIYTGSQVQSDILVASPMKDEGIILAGSTKLPGSYSNDNNPENLNFHQALLIFTNKDGFFREQ